METKQQTKVDLSGLSSSEIKAALAEAEKREAAEKARARAKYEKDRDDAARMLMTAARQLNKDLTSFKDIAHNVMEAQHQALAAYGDLNKKSKGGFSIVSSDGSIKITRRRDTNPTWDERSHKAIELLKDFLGDTVKKAAEKEYEILMSFIERNQAGDLEYSKVMHLLQHQDKYNDERWIEGLRLLKESYKIALKGFGYEFKVLDKEGKWEPLPLNFSSI